MSETHGGPGRLTWAELSGLRWSGEPRGEYSGVDPPELILGCSSMRERLVRMSCSRFSTAKRSSSFARTVNRSVLLLWLQAW